VSLLLAGLGAVGAVAGAAVNLGAYRLGFVRRAISPWSAPLESAPPRRWSDRLPIVGWLGLRREASLHGAGFWIRPLLVELVAALGLPGLYWWEVLRGGLLGWPAGMHLPAGLASMLLAQFAAHAVLMMLMLLASLIDLDEKIIPDTITLPGTLLGLLAVACWPQVLLPLADKPGLGAGATPLWITSPLAWPAGLDGFPRWPSLGLGLACWWLWCVGLMPRTWYTRHGWARALSLCLAHLRRDPFTLWIGCLGLAGTAVIVGLWWRSGAGWPSMLSALFGMAAGGLLIWAVRIVGTAVLRREAMGFGDVTLMAMLGVLLGWQGCLVVFFLAPLAALVVGVGVLALQRETEIPYGPFLCLAAGFVLVRWSAVWQRVEPIFTLGSVVPLILLLGLGLMVVLLWILRAIKSLFA